MLLIVLMVKTMSSNKIKQGHVFKGYFSLNPLDLFLKWNINGSQWSGMFLLSDVGNQSNSQCS